MRRVILFALLMLTSLGCAQAPKRVVLPRGENIQIAVDVVVDEDLFYVKYASQQKIYVFTPDGKQLRTIDLADFDDKHGMIIGPFSVVDGEVYLMTSDCRVLAYSNPEKTVMQARTFRAQGDVVLAMPLNVGSEPDEKSLYLLDKNFRNKRVIGHFDGGYDRVYFDMDKDYFAIGSAGIDEIDIYSRLNQGFRKVKLADSVPGKKVQLNDVRGLRPILIGGLALNNDQLVVLTSRTGKMLLERYRIADGKFVGFQALDVPITITPLDLKLIRDGSRTRAIICFHGGSGAQLHFEELE